MIFVLSILLLVAYGCAHGRLCHPDPGVSTDNMKDTVRYLTTLQPARSHDHPESMKRAAAYIYRKLAEYGFEPMEQTYVISGSAYANVLASAGPAEGSRLIVGAHYDVCGESPGADDNASAVAGLLEVARFAKKHESELPGRVDFVAYALEEPPFFETAGMGSHVHAESLHNQGVRVKGMICLEMIGYFTEEAGSQNYPLALLRLFYPSTGNFIGVISNFGSSCLASRVARHLKATSVRVRTLRAPSSIRGVDFSDHRSYWEFGYDAVMITDTAFYRNPNYHRETDTIDTLDFGKMHEVVKGLCWCILNIK
ncbi:MAG: M28 family peptidase [bacterium]